MASYFAYGYYLPELVAASGEPDICAAVKARLVATSNVNDGFGNSATTPKFWADYAQKQTLPYAVITEISEAESFWSVDGQSVINYDGLGMFQVAVFAAGKKTARDLARKTAAALNDSPLTFADGTLLECRQSDQFFRVNDDMGVTSPVVYQRIVVFTYRVQRNL